MKFGVSTLALYPSPIEKILDFVENLGMDYCEIINEYPFDDLNYEIFESYFLDVVIHAPISDINIASHNHAMRRASIEEIKSSITLASKINSEKIVIHPGIVPVLGKKFINKIEKYNIDALREIRDHAENLGVKICLENMPNLEECLCKDLNEVYKIVNDLGIYTTLDVGHANTMGLDVEKLKIDDSVIHIHISDNDGSYDTHDALGEGNINFTKLFKKKLKNYSDTITIEIKTKEELLKSIEYLKAKKIL